MPLKFFLIPAILGMLLGLSGLAVYHIQSQQPKDIAVTKINNIPQPTPKPLDRFTFDALSKTDFIATPITIESELRSPLAQKATTYTAYFFSFTWEDKKISGQINIPNQYSEIRSQESETRSQNQEQYPVILLLRGYVDQERYRTGMGTERVASVLAAQGYITLAPDFLGYGDSDPEPTDIWEARFSNVAVVLQLLASVRDVPWVDTDKLGIWAHSNGGQIALSVLEILGRRCRGELVGNPNNPTASGSVENNLSCSIPTTLWAPVSKPFPYSVLYYTDEFEDQGTYLRKALAEFEKDYDVRPYSIADYFDWIQSPILLHQGTADDAIPVEWSTELVTTLKALDKDITYHVYPGADHDMVGSWEAVVKRDVEWFDKWLR